MKLRSIAFIILMAVFLAGCAKRPQVSPEASPSPSETNVATPAGAAGATEAAASPAASATPTPMPNLISFARGTLLRSWPATDPKRSPTALLTNDMWYSAEGASGSLEFVFELAQPATINQLKFLANASEDTDAQTVHVATSTSGSDSGFSDVGTYALTENQEKVVPLAPPVNARWVELSIDARGSKGTTLRYFQALGQLIMPAQARPMAGSWLFDSRVASGDDALFASGNKFPTSPAYQRFKAKEELLDVIQAGNSIRAAQCNATSIRYVWGATQNGAAVTWSALQQNAPWGPGVENADGSMLVGANPDGGDPYIAIRQAGAAHCPIEAPSGAGRTVLVLVPGNEAAYEPYKNPKEFPGFRFVPKTAALLGSADLQGVETAVLAALCDANTIFAQWQASALVDFVSAGHKLIIHDADDCTKTDYSFLPYAFKTSNPGARGAHGSRLILVESSTLGANKTDPAHFIDVPAYVQGSNQLGDANTVVTQDSHWCGHLFGTNALNVNGFMHMYAPHGRGLFIYNGLDRDDYGLKPYKKLIGYELAQPVPALVPCTQSVALSFLISPSVEKKFVPGRAQTFSFPMDVLANQGYAGTVSLAPKAPADAPWKTSLSTSQVTLNGNAVPLKLTIEVPANAAPGGHQFLVTGDDGRGHTASAIITLVAAVAPKVVKVQPVRKGCTEQLTLGADALFAFGEATLTQTAKKTLTLLGPTIKKAGKHPARIYGDTDSIGSDSYNQVLSEQRARSVRDWLAAHGYIKASTTIKGFGKQHPVAPNTNPNGSDNPQGRAKNRRVEVLIDTCR